MAKGSGTVKTAVITGGTGGLGRALDAALQERGWFTVLIDLPGSEAKAERAEGTSRFFPCDLTDSAALQDVCAQVCASRPSVDLVIYNAGITQIGRLDETPLETHRRVFEINYFAAVEMAKALQDAVRASKGTHLAISSVAGFAPLHRRTAYAASKHALEGFFKSLRSEEREHGVDCLIAAPSFVGTNLGNPQAQPDGIARPGSATDGIDYMTPEEAAAVILKGYDRRAEAIPVGRVARMSYLVNRLSPALFARLMEKNIKRESQT